MAKSITPYTSDKELTNKQKLWIEEYLKCDDYAIASKNAGYKGSHLRQIGYENSIRLSIFINKRREEINKKIESKNIAELEDIYKFWTKVFTDENVYIKDRLKASELLAKSKGAFIEKVEVKQIDTDWFIGD